MTNLFYSWKENLTLLLPRNLKPFALVTLKSIIEGGKVYLKYFWWIPVIMLGRTLASDYLFNDQTDAYHGLQYYVVFFIRYYVLTLFITHCSTIAIWLTIRPSIDRKNCAHFRSMIVKYFLTLSAFTLLYIFVWINLLRFHRNFALPAPFAIFIDIFSIWYLLAVFFITDTPSTFRNFFKNSWHALVMLLYNLPIISIAWCFHIGIAIIFSYLNITSFDLDLPFYAVSTCNSLNKVAQQIIWTCTLANIYIKRVYEQCDLYFKP
jgi:hypothetical protein